jgi:superfamily II DNA or RNA helicase
VVRRQTVPARLLAVADALPFLLHLADSRHDDPRGDDEERDLTSMTPSAVAWSAVITAGLSVLARGRLVPAVTPSGFDAWRVGPLDPADLRLIAELAAALPAVAHAAVLPGTSPIRVSEPTALVRAMWDSLADTLTRSAAATVVTGHQLFAAVEPLEATGLRSWLVEAERGLESGARVGLRVETPPDATPRAVIQLTSRVDPSLIVDAVELFRAPAIVLARLGATAEEDLLLALRRGGRAWPPLAGVLAERSPTDLSLDEDLLADLVETGAALLAAAEIDVLWPAEMLADGLTLRAVITPSPAAVTAAGFSLDALLEFRWQVCIGDDSLTEAEIDALSEAKRGVVRLRGRWVAVDPALLARLRERKACRLSGAEALGALLAGEIEIDGEVAAVVAEGPIADIAERLRGLADAGPLAFDPPPGLAAELRPYQQRGVAWLAEMCDLGLGGCLADDMGLGKTIQVIALHLHRRTAAQTDHRPTTGRRTRKGAAAGNAVAAAGPTLVVCPTSLLGNWEREIGRFAPDVPVRRYHGTGRHLEDLATDEIVVATYGIVRRDHDALAAAGFSLVVADEAQNAKNPLSETARSLRAVPAAARVALSGTPVENRLTELWSILDWTTPGLLGPLEHFRRTVALPIERHRDPSATERLSRSVRPFLLRRKKTDPNIAPDLPPRIVTDQPIPLTTEQTTLYEAEVREALAAIETKSGIERQGLIFRMLTVLKQICNHPAQYLHQPGPLAGRSGKLAALEELVEVILAEGESMLVFSQYVQCCALIEARLAELGVPTLMLHGQVSARGREAMVDAFQAGEAPVFLLSLKAGGVGLNLTRATHVVHYDRWWNPAVEDQATDRAHRIGQDRTVQVHRLIAEGTLEDRIADLLERKRDLADAVVGEGEAWLSELSDAELSDLVRLGREQ